MIPHDLGRADRSTASAHRAELDAARLLLDRMRVTLADLAAVSSGTDPTRQCPTFEEYIPAVRGAVSEGTRRVYGSYWNRIVQRWADRRLDEITPTEIR